MFQLRLNSLLKVVGFILMGLCFGCFSDGNTNLKPDEFVGKYVYKSEDSGQPHDPDTLTIKAGGDYALVPMHGGLPGPTKEGKWRLFNDPPSSIALDDHGYGVEKRGKTIRLRISSDRGHYFEKIE